VQSTYREIVSSIAYQFINQFFVVWSTQL